LEQLLDRAAVHRAFQRRGEHAARTAAAEQGYLGIPRWEERGLLRPEDGAEVLARLLRQASLPRVAVGFDGLAYAAQPRVVGRERLAHVAVPGLQVVPHGLRSSHQRGLRVLAVNAGVVLRHELRDALGAGGRDTQPEGDIRCKTGLLLDLALEERP